MSIHNYLSNEQINMIIAIIKAQCDAASRKNYVEENKCIDSEIYDKIKKCRKAHDITGDIYVSFFYKENMIGGLNTSLIANGCYSQPELSNKDVVVHIYHHTNQLNSKLVKERAKENKIFFCILFEPDKSYCLKSIYAINVSTGKRENLYSKNK